MEDNSEPLENIIDRLKRQIERATDALSDDFTPEAVQTWQDQVKTLLSRYMLASWLLGAQTENPPVEDETGRRIWQAIFDALAKQLDFLNNFAKELSASAERGEDWNDAWNTRSSSYADSVAQTYSQGAVYRESGGDFLPLPAYPGDMTTQCGTRCRCKWRITPLKNSGDYDCTWRLDPNDAANCQTCEIRAERWQPLRVRSYELQEIGE